MKYSEIFILFFGLHCHVSVQATIEIVSDVNNSTNNVVKVGEVATLTCSTSSKIKICSFTKKDDEKRYYNFYAQDVTGNMEGYENGRINRGENYGDQKCSMKISPVQDSDNGDWICKVVDEESKQTVEQTINLLVAIPPTEVYLESQNQRLNDGPLNMNISAEISREMKCIVKGGRPESKIKWFLDSKELSSGQNEYEYFGNLEDSGKHLKCQIEHEGFTKEDIENGKNIAKVELEIVGEAPTSSLAIGIGVGIGILIALLLLSAIIFVKYFRRNDSGEYQMTEGIEPIETA